MLSFQLFIIMALSTDGDLDQSELASRIKNGDKKAFQTFFNRHYQSLYGYLISKNLDAATAEDLIQNAFLYIWNHRDNIDPARSLRAYLFRIGYTRLLNHFRDRAKFDTSQAVPVEETTLTPEDQLRGKELHRAIENAVKNMPEKRREVFKLCFMEELTYREAAEIMDITRKTVENHMSLAFKDIRAALKHFME